MLQDVISILGIANPQLSFQWQDGAAAPTTDAGRPFLLESNTTLGEWMAPASGLMNKAFSQRLTMGDGSSPIEDSWAIKLQPDVYLRLVRLYSRVIEGKTSSTDQSQRPVPCYFAYHEVTEAADPPKGGIVNPGDRLSISAGRMSIHDENGKVIDPVAVCITFVAIATARPAIVAKDFNLTTAPTLSATQVATIASTATTDEIRLRLISLFGKPVATGDTQFTNLDVINAEEGLYKIKTIGPPVVVVVSPSTINERREIGAASFGTLTNSFTPQSLKTGVALKRDFITVYADDINVHLRGSETLSAPFNKDDFKVPVFHDEPLELLLNGNQVLSKQEEVVRNAAGFTLVISPVIEADFSVAQDPINSEWPVFPAGNNGAIAGRLENVSLSAHFITSVDDPRDVFLQMTVPEKTPGTPQLATGTAVRIYNRKFLADAREGRGNGAGAVLGTGATAGFILRNPFGLRKQEALPARPRLSFDMIAVNRVGQKRSFGLLATNVEAPSALSAAEQTLADKGTNLFNTATERSIGPAGIVGLSTQRLDTLPAFSDAAGAVDAALTLGNENQPRIAPRVPLMSRNETIVSGRNASGSWASVLSGLWLRADSRSSLHRLGSPGSPGGEEFLGMGIATSGGLLAYQVARAALRRTRGLAARLQELETDSRWNIPPITATGNFSAAVLQDISPGADSANLKLLTDTMVDTLPSDWTSLVNAIGNIIPAAPAANTAVRNAINSLAGSATGAFLYSEFKHELLTAKYGRRDSLPALTSAIKSAKDLVYIETSSFNFTDYITNTPSNPENANDPPNTDTDLVSLLKKQLQANPGLRVLICVSKEVNMGKGYEVFAARAYDRRIKTFNALKQAASDRVQLFHPIGYPGRPIRLMHTIVIVDDLWMFAGSGSFNRRGFMFDANLSMVTFNHEIEHGRSKAIRNFRRQLMSNHLGSKPIPGSPAPVFLHANEARLADLYEAFYAVTEMLEQGGSGLIQKLFDGKVTGQEPIPASSFPHRDVADPDGSIYPTALGSLLQAFAGLGEAEV